MKKPTSLKGHAADYWKRNAPLCERMGTLTDADKDSFALLCQTWGRLVQAEASGAGSIEFVCLVKQYQQQAKNFGLDPLSRRRLKIDRTTDDTPDPFGI